MTNLYSLSGKTQKVFCSVLIHEDFGLKNHRLGDAPLESIFAVLFELFELFVLMSNDLDG
jgi:hypothetical protein